MVIDFHTHVYPEYIAKKVIKNLGVDTYFGAYRNGTIEGLLISMKQSGIDISISLPIITKPEQYDGILTYAESQLHMSKLIPFAGIHPNCEDIEGKLAQIAAKGFRGIKLHPDYQGFYIDDALSIQLIKKALKAGLIVLVHSGMDETSIEDIHCTPERAARCIEQIPEIEREHLPFVLAHTGGCDAKYNYDDVERYLVGRNIYMDTSFTLGFILQKQFLRIIQKHGTDKILFGTDSPWTNQKEELKKFINLPLSDDDKEKILWKNAAILLGLTI